MANTQPILGDFKMASGRRYDLDWLRVIAFGLLIFYHVGMFYVSWGWHVKSIYAGPAAEPLMTIVNPWRLALLFFISGVAIRFATDRGLDRLRFAQSRLFRLGLPILMGMIVVVTPQDYFELRQSGEIEAGYLVFWENYLKLEQIYTMTTPTWNHLWYVVYLLVYILLITPFLPMAKRFAEGSGASAISALLGGPMRLLLITIIPFVIYQLALSPHYPHTHALIGDWANHAHRFTIFMLGYFVAKDDHFWRSVHRALPLASFFVITLLVSGFLVEMNEDALAQSWAARIPFIEEIMTALDTLYAWSFIVMLLGLAQRYMNRPSRLLRYLTSAVFCYYILHQTITVIAGFYLTQLQLGAWPEFLLVTGATVGGCIVGYEVLRRVPYLRLFFGIRQRVPKGSPAMASAPAT